MTGRGVAHHARDRHRVHPRLGDMIEIHHVVECRESADARADNHSGALAEAPIARQVRLCHRFVGSDCRELAEAVGHRNCRRIEMICRIEILDLRGDLDRVLARTIELDATDRRFTVTRSLPQRGRADTGTGNRTHACYDNFFRHFSVFPRGCDR
jgi:hypothetical protein